MHFPGLMIPVAEINRIQAPGIRDVKDFIVLKGLVDLREKRLSIADVRKCGKCERSIT